MHPSRTAILLFLYSKFLIKIITASRFFGFVKTPSSVEVFVIDVVQHFLNLEKCKLHVVDKEVTTAVEEILIYTAVVSFPPQWITSIPYQIIFCKILPIISINTMSFVVVEFGYAGRFESYATNFHTHTEVKVWVRYG